MIKFDCRHNSGDVFKKVENKKSVAVRRAEERTKGELW